MNAHDPERAITAMSPRRLALIVVASAVAVALMPFWVLRDWDSSLESKAFVSTPQFILWLLILCGQAAIWVGTAAFVGATVCQRWRDLRRRKALPGNTIAALVVSAVAITLLALLLNFGPRLGIYDEIAGSRIPTGSAWPLWDHDSKMPWLIGIALLIGLVAIAGMWLTMVAFGDLARHGTARASTVVRFIALRAELTALLAVAGTLIGLATLASGALREAVLAANAEPVYRDKALACLEKKFAGTEATTEEVRRTVRTEFDDLIKAYPKCKKIAFDREYVLAYGLLFTGILGIAFAPSFLAMRRAGARLRDRSYPLPGPRKPEFFEIVEKRSSFDVLLQTNLSATATFKAGVAILTPLAASVISTYLPS